MNKADEEAKADDAEEVAEEPAEEKAPEGEAQE